MYNKLLGHLVGFFLNLPGDKFRNILRNYFYGDVISERIVEYALCFAHLDKRPFKSTKVLDIGCYYSNFPIQLASMGFSVTGVDMMNYELTHPNFHFIQGDINKLQFKHTRFDIITCISTLEHIGLSVYGDDLNMNADVVAVNKMHKLLKPGGVVLVTVPFGRKTRTPTYKSYDWKELTTVFAKFKTVETRFYKEHAGKWIPTERATASKVDNRRKARAIVFVKAKKT